MDQHTDKQIIKKCLAEFLKINYLEASYPCKQQQYAYSDQNQHPRKNKELKIKLTDVNLSALILKQNQR